MRADEVHARLAAYLDARPARTVEVQWLVRRAFCRGARRAGSRRAARAAGARLRAQRRRRARAARGRRDALERELRRAPRARCCESSRSSGVSWQAHLVAGALPERAAFGEPAARADVRAARVAPVRRSTSTLCARYLPNELAMRLVRRRVQDADEIARAEAGGDQGVSDRGYDRTQDARDLLSYLQSASHPPLLRATLAVAVAAADAEELERRVEIGAPRLRRGPPAPPARRPAAAVRRVAAGPARRGRRLRRRPDRRAGRGDDAARDARGRLAPRLPSRPHAQRRRATRSASTCARAPTTTATRRSSRSARSGRARRRSTRSSPTRRSCSARA